MTVTKRSSRGSGLVKSIVLVAGFAICMFIVSHWSSLSARHALPRASRTPVPMKLKKATPTPEATEEHPRNTVVAKDSHSPGELHVEEVLESFRLAQQSGMKLSKRNHKAGGKDDGSSEYLFTEAEAVKLIQESCRLHKVTYDPKVFTKEHMPGGPIPLREEALGAKGRTTETIQYVSMRRHNMPLTTGASNQQLAGKLGVASTLGTVLFHHGCSHSAKDFCFIPEDGQEDQGDDNLGRQGPQAGFNGLPEEMKWAIEVVRRGWDYLALSSRDKHSRCWGSHKFTKEDQVNNIDLLNVLAMIHHEEEILSEQLPADEL